MRSTKARVCFCLLGVEIWRGRVEWVKIMPERLQKEEVHLNEGSAAHKLEPQQAKHPLNCSFPPPGRKTYLSQKKIWYNRETAQSASYSLSLRVLFTYTLRASPKAHWTDQIEDVCFLEPRPFLFPCSIPWRIWATANLINSSQNGSYLLVSR